MITGIISERASRPNEVGEAIYDSQRIYRYRLSRAWNTTRPSVCWIMLNPSTATAGVDDRTMARVASFSKAWGYGSSTVVNLFAFRAEQPGLLTRVGDPVGPHNDATILETAASAAHVVAAWGNHGTIANPETDVPRCEEVRHLLASAAIELHCLTVTYSGQPGHPLYLPASATPTPLDQPVGPSPARIS
ncbi:MAG TPA: DUF1643 domain-containing protein [Acidimicrobiia bacterium]